MLETMQGPVFLCLYIVLNFCFVQFNKWFKHTTVSEV